MCQTEGLHSISFQVFFSLPFPNVLYGLTATRIRELNPKDLGKSSIWRARVWGQFESLGFALTMLSLFEESAKKKQKRQTRCCVRTKRSCYVRHLCRCKLLLHNVDIRLGSHCFYMQFNAPPPFIVWFPEHKPPEHGAQLTPPPR